MSDNQSDRRPGTVLENCVEHPEAFIKNSFGSCNTLYRGDWPESSTSDSTDLNHPLIRVD